MKALVYLDSKDHVRVSPESSPSLSHAAQLPSQVNSADLVKAGKPRISEDHNAVRAAGMSMWQLCTWCDWLGRKGGILDPKFRGVVEVS